jgi:hypothetical protein
MSVEDLAMAIASRSRCIVLAAFVPRSPQLSVQRIKGLYPLRVLQIFVIITIYFQGTAVTLFARMFVPIRPVSCHRRHCGIVLNKQYITPLGTFSPTLENTRFLWLLISCYCFPNFLLLTHVSWKTLRVSLNLFPVPHLLTLVRYTRFETTNSIFRTYSHCLNWLHRLLRMLQSASRPARLTSSTR